MPRHCTHITRQQRRFGPLGARCRPMRVLNFVADDFELVVATPIAATPINLIDAAAFVAELVLIAILVARGLRDAVPRASKVASAFDQVIQCRTGRGRRAHDREGGPCHVVVLADTPQVLRMRSEDASADSAG